MKELSLPEPVAAYFAADRCDGPAVARCFTNDGVVVDEGKTHAGVAAIEAWKTAASVQSSYVTDPIGLERTDQGFIVTARVTGDFPGSPLNLQYLFALDRDRIASLEITP